MEKRFRSLEGLYISVMARISSSESNPLSGGVMAGYPATQKEITDALTDAMVEGVEGAAEFELVTVSGFSPGGFGKRMTGNDSQSSDGSFFRRR